MWLSHLLIQCLQLTLPLTAGQPATEAQPLSPPNTTNLAHSPTSQKETERQTDGEVKEVNTRTSMHNTVTYMYTSMYTVCVKYEIIASTYCTP